MVGPARDLRSCCRRAAGLDWLKAALTYLSPLLVSNDGVLAAARRQRGGDIAAATIEQE